MLFFSVSLLHPHTLFSLNHQLNCIADFFFVFTVFVCYHVVVVVGMLYFCSNLCNFSCADRVNCQHLFLDFYLLCLPNISLCFRAAFLDILVHLFWLPFRDEILIRFSHSHNFITTITFPQNNNSEKLKMSINSFLFCYVAHHTLSPCLFACFSCFFHQYRQLQAAPSSTNSILHNVLLEKRDNVMTSKQFPPPGNSS